MNQFSRKNNSGFGLVEVLIAFGLIGILTAVMTTLFTNIQKQQRQTNTITSINTLRETIMKTLADGRAWENTINDLTNRAASTNCLVTRDGTCLHAAPGADPNPLTNAFFSAAPFIPLPVLRDAGAAGGNTIITGVATDGFTINGVRCTTFIAPPAAGNDSCPFQWRIRMQYTCPAGPGTCVDPAVRVIAMLFYNPNPASGLATVINESKYMVILTRGARGENRSERIELTHQTVGAPTNGQGGGACNPGGWANIPLNAELVDEGNNVAIAAGDAVLNPGTYNCTATASCFSCRSLSMRLVNVTAGTNVVSPGDLGPAGTMLNVTVVVPDIRANGPTTLRLQHFCQSHPECVAPGCPVTWGMGMALADYGVPTKFSTLSCTRVF